MRKFYPSLNKYTIDAQFGRTGYIFQIEHKYQEIFVFILIVTIEGEIVGYAYWSFPTWILGLKNLESLDNFLIFLRVVEVFSLGNIETFKT